MPTCMVITSPDITDVLRPTPPSLTGSDRYAGIHRLNPHQANIVNAFMIVTASVREAIFPLKMSAKRGEAPDGSAVRDSVQIFGSRTSRRTHSVNNAGSTPTK